MNRNIKGLMIGDTVVVSRAGDVIPKITRVFPELRTGNEKAFKDGITQLGSKDFIIHCLTEKEWLDVCKKIEKDIPKTLWQNGEKPTEFNFWNHLGEGSAILYLKEDDHKLTFSSYGYISSLFKYENPNILLEAKDFLKI